MDIYQKDRTRTIFQRHVPASGEDSEVLVRMQQRDFINSNFFLRLVILTFSQPKQPEKTTDRNEGEKLFP